MNFMLQKISSFENKIQSKSFYNKMEPAENRLNKVFKSYS